MSDKLLIFLSIFSLRHYFVNEKIPIGIASIKYESTGFAISPFSFNSIKYLKGNSSKGILLRNYSTKKIDVEKTEQIVRKKAINSPSLGSNFYNNKVVLLRCDLNIPYKIVDDNSEPKILDSTRIVESLQSIAYLSSQGAKVVLVSHLGRPKGVGYEPNFSMAFLENVIQMNLDKYMLENYSGVRQPRVIFLEYQSDIDNSSTKSAIDRMNPGDILLMDNIRFYKGETSNDEEFCQKLSSLCNIYVNDAFGTSHRKHASVYGVTRFFQFKLAGFLLSRELHYLQTLLFSKPQRPFVAIIGGSKISTKIKVIKNLIPRIDKLILGGGMVFTFLKARDVYTGKSVVEDNMIPIAKEIEDEAKKYGVEFILPVDFITTDKISSTEPMKIKEESTFGISEGYIGADIGHQTVDAIKGHLNDCNTIIWNGPLGITEINAFKDGTDSVAHYISQLSEKNKKLISIVGGGDTVVTIERLNLKNKFSHVSTGGGASLELLEKGTLPAIEVLDKDSLDRYKTENILDFKMLNGKFINCTNCRGLGEKILQNANLIIPKLNLECHKGQYGKVCVIGGSKDYSGAPYFAAHSALKTGADLSYIITTELEAPIIKSYCADVIVLSKLLSDESLLTTKALPKSADVIRNAADDIIRFISRMDAIIIGCGMGYTDDTVSALILILLKELKNTDLPVILDADVIRILSKRSAFSFLKNMYNCILTPNYNEFNIMKHSIDSEEEFSSLEIKSINRLMNDDFDQLPDQVKNQISEIERIASYLNGPTIIVKGEVDYIINSRYSVFSMFPNDICSLCPKRSGGQGDIFCGVLGTFVGWSNRGVYSEEIHKFCSEILIFNSRDCALLIAAFSSSLLTKLAAGKAFLKYFRGVTASDILKEIPFAFQEMFPT